MALAVKLDRRLIGYITTLENLTKARVKEAFVFDDFLLFIVQSGDAGKAIGRRGITIQKLGRLFKKRIKVVEMSTRVEDFVRGFLDPLKVESMEMNDKRIVLHVKDTTMKGKIIGRNGKNLKLLNELLERYFDARAAVA